MTGARLRQHLLRVVDSGELGLRPTPVQLFCAVARAAPEIDYALRILERDLSDQVCRRATALRGKLKIKVGIPAGHRL